MHRVAYLFLLLIEMAATSYWFIPNFIPYNLPIVVFCLIRNVHIFVYYHHIYVAVSSLIIFGKCQQKTSMEVKYGADDSLLS